MPTKIEISYKTIVFTFFFLILIWFLVQVKEVIFWIFVAFIFMSALKPTVTQLEKRNIPRVLAVLINYIFILILLFFIGGSMLPPLISQSGRLAENLPDYIRTLFPFITIDSALINQYITPLGENLLRVTVGIFSNLIAIFTIFVICFYLLLERKNLGAQLTSFMGADGAKIVEAIITRIEERLGAWVRGQLTLAVIVGIFTFIGLTLLSIPFTLPLSILAGILEIVPIIGPIIAGVPAILVAFTISPLTAAATFALYSLIQQAEANFVVPLVMRKAVGLPPLITIPSLFIGAKVAGVTGALLAIPVVVTVATIIAEYQLLRPQKKPTEARKPDSVSSPAEASAKAGR